MLALCNPKGLTRNFLKRCEYTIQPIYRLESIILIQHLLADQVLKTSKPHIVHFIFKGMPNLDCTHENNFDIS